MRICRKTPRVPEGSSEQPHHRVGDYQRGKLSSGQNKISKREDIGGPSFCDSLVNPFVMPADENNMRRSGQRLGNALIESFSRRFKNDHTPLFRQFERFKRRVKLLATQKHSWTSSEGRIINRVVFILRKIAWIRAFPRTKLFFDRPMHDALAHGALDDLWEQRDEIEMEHYPPHSKMPETVSLPASLETDCNVTGRGKSAASKTGLMRSICDSMRLPTGPPGSTLSRRT